MDLRKPDAIFAEMGQLYPSLAPLATNEHEQLAVVVGVNGWFPPSFLNSFVGEPIGTSSYFAKKQKLALLNRFPYLVVHTLPIDSQGKIAVRVEKSFTLLSNHFALLSNASIVMFSAHSQGVIVSTHLISKLISHNIINPHSQNVGLLAMAGISHGPFPSLKYVKYVVEEAAKELFEFCSDKGKETVDYYSQMNNILESGVNVVAIGSWLDQVVPLYSATMHAFSHQNIFRSFYMPTPTTTDDKFTDFFTLLISVSLELRNAGYSDFGLNLHLTDLLAGNLYNSRGHQTLYEDEVCYLLAVDWICRYPPINKHFTTMYIETWNKLMQNVHTPVLAFFKNLTQRAFGLPPAAIEIRKIDEDNPDLQISQNIFPDIKMTVSQSPIKSADSQILKTPILQTEKFRDESNLRIYPPMKIEHFKPVVKVNSYMLPWIILKILLLSRKNRTWYGDIYVSNLRYLKFVGIEGRTGVIEGKAAEEYMERRNKLRESLESLVHAFKGWDPPTKPLKELKYKLELLNDGDFKRVAKL
ncbi:hypothetical protein HK098_003678 [Nowakowskiella sp. JEL0407]|nr:hypothetical protein HK098_003678 [Nowakowskiella sp. JEL0407]